MKGFFDLKPTIIEKLPRAQKRLRQTSANKTVSRTYDCNRCQLYVQCISPKMEYTGKGKLKILIVAEAPGKKEDEVGKQLVGEAGQLLREVLEMHDCDLDRDFYKTNALICRPPNNRTPTATELKCCRANWQRVIEKTKPNAIWLMGGVALDAFYMDRVSKDDLSIGSWRRWCIPDKVTGAWVLPLFHPSFVLRNKDKDELLQTVFEKDIRWALSCSKKPPPKFKDYTKVNIIADYDEVIKALSQIKSGDVITFDYETTGLKPYRSGHKILTIAVKRSVDSNAVAFPFQWREHWNEKQRQSIEKLWRSILVNPRIEKIAQNIKFEHNWSRLILGVETEGWLWDTMINQHLLDVRPRLSGLKIQALLRFGVEKYDENVKKYIRAENSNAFNKLEEVPLSDVLLYNGIDVNIEEALYLEQAKQMNGNLCEARKLFHEGVLAFSDMEFAGIHTDEQYYKDTRMKMQKRMESIKKWLVSSDEAKRFKEQIGHDLNLNSTKDLSALFYEVLNETPTRFTEKAEKPSMDETALANFTSSFAKKYLKLKKIEKIEGTFLKGFEEESFDGYMHPFFNLHIPRTGRSSSDSPNFQNIPKRNKEAMLMVRKGIIPRPGFELVGADYKQMEVCIQACYSRDEVMAKYVVDKDMHLESAMDIFMLPAEQISKSLRHQGKNGFNFPEIYGDWYKSIAQSIWEEIVDGVADNSGKRVIDHLQKNGIEDYADFEEHIRGVEDRFWNKFHATKEWRNKQVALYKKKTYVDTFFGFRRNGYLKRNEICNTPVQATAFHCLLWSLIEINRMRKAENWKTSIVGQIHDQVVFDMLPKEKSYVMRVVEDVMCRTILNGRPWIIVPLKVDFESSGIDKSWAYSEDEK